MISKEEVKHIAKLARLELTEQEIEKMQKDLSSVLDYFEILKKAGENTYNSVAAQVTEVADNVVREDKAVEKPAGLAENLVKQAPVKDGDYIKVKQVL